MINRTHSVGDYHTKTIDIHTENACSVAMKMCKNDADKKKNNSKSTTDDVSYGAEDFLSLGEIWEGFVILLFHEKKPPQDKKEKSLLKFFFSNFYDFFESLFFLVDGRVL